MEIVAESYIISSDYVKNAGGDMHILFFKWKSFMNPGIEAAFRELKLSYDTYEYQFSDWEKDDEFLEKFKSYIKADTQGFDVVFSVNYSPLISTVCQELEIAYKSWIYDSPIHIKSEETLYNEVNTLYCFDMGQAIAYQKKGINAVHQPLAADGHIFLGRDYDKPIRKYDSDISFVGQLYKTDYDYYCGPLTDYQRGFLEGIIGSQQKLFGAYIIPNLITDELLAGLNERYDKASKGTACISREQLVYMLSCETTGRDRFLALALLSNHFDVRHYASELDERLSRINFCGYADYYRYMPWIFKGSRINLNISLRTIETGIPLRCLDIMSCGGLLVSNYQMELAEYFENGKELILYTEPEELFELCQFYLRPENDELRRSIALAGREKVEKEFNYKKQLSQILM